MSFAADHILDCLSCEEDRPNDECPASERPCGHHCAHSLTHNVCCWCDEEFGECCFTD